MVFRPLRVRQLRQFLPQLFGESSGVDIVRVVGISGVIKDHFDAASYPARGFVLFDPDPAKDFDNVAHQDRVYRKIANDRVSVVSERVPPLVAVFSVAPVALVITHVCDGAGFECLGGRSFGSPRCTFGLTELDRVIAIANQLAATLGLFAGLSQADIVQATKPHSAVLAVPLEAKQTT